MDCKKTLNCTILYDPVGLMTLALVDGLTVQCGSSYNRGAEAMVVEEDVVKVGLTLDEKNAVANNLRPQWQIPARHTFVADNII